MTETGVKPSTTTRRCLAVLSGLVAVFLVGCSRTGGDASAAVFDELDGVVVVTSDDLECRSDAAAICGQCHVLSLESVSQADVVAVLDRNFFVSSDYGGAENATADYKAIVAGYGGGSGVPETMTVCLNVVERRS